MTIPVIETDIWNHSNGPSILPFGPGRCIYIVLLPRRGTPPVDAPGESPFAHVDYQLLLSAEIIYHIATMPIYIHELISPGRLYRLPPNVVTSHAIMYCFDDYWPSMRQELQSYPFVAVADFRTVVHGAPYSPPIGHVYLGSDDFEADTVLAHWKQNAVAAVERIIPSWRRDVGTRHLPEIASAIQSIPEFRPPHPAHPMTRQDCLRPNAILRNIGRGYRGRAALHSVPPLPPMNVANTAEIQREQIKMASDVITDVAADRNGLHDAILVVPSINPYYSDAALRKIENIGGGPPGLAKTVIEGAGYMYYSNPRKESEAMILAAVLDYRRHERQFYDAVATCYAAARQDVVFRTPQIPGSMFDRLDALAKMKWEQSTVQRSSERWDAFSELLTEKVGRETLEWIASTSSSVTVLSDLPIEWCRVKGVPLSYLLPVNRVPLAPGNLPARLVVDHRPPAYWERISDVKLLIASGHHSDDHLRDHPKALARIAEELGFTVSYVEVRNEQEFLGALDQHRPKILFLSAHGVLTRSKGSSISLPDGPADLRFDDLPWTPDCAIVSACRSDAVVRTYGSPVSNLFAAGVRSVVGSYLNLTEPHATMVAVGLLSNISAVLCGETPRASWDVIVSSTLALRRPIDVLVAAERRVGRTKTGQEPVIELFKKFTEEYNRRGYGRIPRTDLWFKVLDLLQELATGKPYEKQVHSVITQKAFRPESMFYTVVGMRRQILVGSWPEMKMVRSDYQ